MAVATSRTKFGNSRRHEGNWRAGTTSSDAGALRFRGSARPGQQPLSVTDGADLDLVMKSLAQAKTELLEAYASDPRLVGRRQRRRAVRDAVDRIAWCSRLLDELVIRRGGTPGDVEQ